MNINTNTHTKVLGTKYCNSTASSIHDFWINKNILSLFICSNKTFFFMFGSINFHLKRDLFSNIESNFFVIRTLSTYTQVCVPRIQISFAITDFSKKDILSDTFLGRIWKKIEFNIPRFWEGDASVLKETSRKNNYLIILLMQPTFMWRSYS